MIEVDAEEISLENQREKLNNFGRTQQRIKREAEPSMEYSVAASHPAQPEQMTRYTQNIR